jgi:hypothetical protein
MPPVRQAAKTPSAAGPERAPPPRPLRPASPVAALQSRIGNVGVQQLITARLRGGPGKETTTPGAPAPAGPRRGPRAAADAAASGAPAAAAQASDSKRAGGNAPAPRSHRAPAAGEGRDEAAPRAESAPRDEVAAAGSGAGAAGAPAAVELHMPEPPSRPSPATMQRIAHVKARAATKASAQATLPPGSKQAGDAQRAVNPPDAERAAEARAKLIAEVNAAPSPEIVALCERIREVIRNKRPPDEDALTEAKPDEAAAEAGNQLNSTIDSETKKVEGNYGAMNTSPAPAPAPGAPGIPPQPAAAETAPINAKAAVPDPVPEASVSLDKDAEASRKKAQAAGMDKPAAQLVQSGPIAEARAAQGELNQVAKEDPAQVLAKQKEALGKADADMAALQMQALEALTASRQGTVKRTGTRQQGMVGTEEQMRAKAGAEAKAAFDEAQSSVRALLKNLAPNAMAKWEVAKTVLTTQFKNDLNIVKDRVNKRHSGASGFVVGLWDAVTGLPDWATEAYDRAEKNFADGVIEKLTAISAEVNSVIAACDLIIKSARGRIAQIFHDLPASLQGWAAEEQKKFDGQLDNLHSEAIAARDAFNKDLIERSSQAVDEVRGEIAELRKKAGGLIGRIAAAVGRFLDDPVKFIIEGLLELVGIAPAAFWAVVAKIKKFVKDIVDDPLGFASNLLKGIGQGFSQFFDNFGTHMIRGFLSWLLGDLKGVEVPKDFSLKSIVTFFLQIMGITWPNIRKILAKKIGEKNVALIEKVYSLVSLLIEKGPEGIFEMIKEQLDPQAIVDQVISMAVDYMVTAITKQVAVRLLLLFNPVGAILQAIEAIYRVLKWVFQNAAKIFTLVETIVNGLADIVAGNIGGFAAAVERGLAMLIPPVLSFIADYFSLGDLPQTVAKQIKSFREWILGLIEKAFDWVIEKGKALLAAVGIGKKEKDKGKGSSTVGETVAFETPGEAHTLYIETTPTGAVVMVASDKPMSVPAKLQSFESRLDKIDEKQRPEVSSKLAAAEPLAEQTDKAADDLVRKKAQEGEANASGKDATIIANEKQLAALLKDLYIAFGEHGTPPAVGRYDKLLKRADKSGQEAHHVPPKGLLAWIVDVAKKAKLALDKSVFAKDKDFAWVKELAGTKSTTWDPGNPLAAITINKETHIKKSEDPTRDVWRVHWGEETAKAVFAVLRGKTVTIMVDGVPTQLNIVFIRRKLYKDLDAEDQQLHGEIEEEAREDLKGSEVGKIPGAAGLVISTQFFKTELWAAFHEVKGKVNTDLEGLADNLGMTARGAAAMSHAAIVVALKNSKVDGSEDEKAKALAELGALSRETWNAVAGISRLNML